MLRPSCMGTLCTWLFNNRIPQFDRISPKPVTEGPSHLAWRHCDYSRIAFNKTNKFEHTSPLRISKSQSADSPNQESRQYRGNDLPLSRRSALSECLYLESLVKNVNALFTHIILLSGMGSFLKQGRNLLSFSKNIFLSRFPLHWVLKISK